VRRHDLGAEARRLLLEPLHHLGAEQSVGEAREVLDVGGQHQLPTRVEALEDERCQVRSTRIERGGVAGWARADHDHVADIGHGLRILPQV
jgi:hypothetical protein